MATDASVVIILLIMIIALSIGIGGIPLWYRKFQQTQVKSVDLSKESNKFSNVFAEQNEKYVTSLGTGYILNFFMNQQIGRAFAIISDKRVYFKGHCFTRSDKKLKRLFEERTVDLKDVTGTGFIRINPTYLLIISIIFTVLFGLGLIVGSTDLQNSVPQALGLFSVFVAPFLATLFYSIYAIKRVNLFEISYAGGSIVFDTYFYSKEEIDDFQKQLRRSKDLAVEKSEINRPNNNESKKQGSVADELKKYAELLDQHLISQEEFDKVKSGLLNQL